MGRNKVQGITIHPPEPLAIKLRLIAKHTNTSMTEIIVKALRKYLDETPV